MFETNYEDIFVFSDEVKAALPNPLPSDVRLFHYTLNFVTVKLRPTPCSP